MKKKIALVAGGFSGESVISICSAEVVERNLDLQKYEVYKIIIDQDSWRHVAADGSVVLVDKNDFSLTLKGLKITFDAAFIIVHGTPGEDGKLQGYFDMIGLPYTGCGSISSALTFNKAFCNRVVGAAQVVHVANSVHLLDPKSYDVEAILKEVGLPCFVKPNAGGSSLGTSKVKTAEELAPAIDLAFSVDTEVLIERFVKGREFSSGIARLNGKLLAFPVTEIVSKKEFFDYEAKYTPGLCDEIVPAPISAELTKKMQETSEKIYHILNCEGIVRVDYIFEEATQNLFFLEVNTVPGQSENSIVPNQIRAMGRTMMDIYGITLEDCLKRA